MAITPTLLLALFCSCLVPSLVAGSGSDTFTDILARSLSGSSARVASSTYSTPVDACLTTNQWRGCRFTGCLQTQNFPFGCLPDGLYLQTEHDCDKHPYSNHHRTSWVGPNLQKNKVAGCEWEFTLFKELICDEDGGNCLTTYQPIDEPDGSYSQVGVVNGRCALNGDAEHCHDALCDQMTLTVQGGVYIANVYSDKPQTIINTPAGDICAVVNLIGGGRQQGPRFEDGSKRLPFPQEERYYPVCTHQEYKKRTSGNSTARAPAKGPLAYRPSGFAFGWRQLYDQTLYCTTTGQTARNTWWYSASQEVARGEDPTRTQQPQAQAQAETQADGYGHIDNMYGGLAVMIVGQTTVSSVNGGLKVEETGSMEYPIYFWQLTTGPVPVQQNFPIVSPGDIKLLFTQEEKQELYFNRR